MLKPPPVRPPDVVGVLAPSSPVRSEFLEPGLAELSRLGFRVRLGSRIGERGRFTAGSPEDRIRDWNELWEDREVKAIFCARGGYGSMQLLSRLSPEILRSDPKIVLGSSDVTALHAFLQSRCGLVSFHGPMVAQQIARESYDSRNLLDLLGSTEPYGRLEAPGSEWLHEGAAEGPLLGGCLSLLAALAGTPFLPSFRGAILFLEDAGAKPYQIDRMLTQLLLCGLLGEVRAIVFGEMPDCEQHPDQGYRLQELLRDWTRELGIPVLFGFPSGHTLSRGLTLPLGVLSRLDEAGLTILEGAVA